MPRPYWSGQPRPLLVSCPIYLTPRTSESERIRLNQINPATGNRISLQSVDVVTLEPVKRADFARGYEIEKRP
jgi:DNA end-binding protein Ku